MLMQEKVCRQDLCIFVCKQVIKEFIFLGSDCGQDTTTTGTSTTATSTAPMTTPKPSFPTLSVNCSSDNITRLLFEAQLSFDITYEQVFDKVLY